ncbi:MAG: AGE family epimerase/isomerase [Chitinophagaceae bacterium]|nr:AGE family epimerase/isomerase [Chitinophagaceae bacterium]
MLTDVRKSAELQTHDIRAELRSYADIYHTELTENILPFWIRYSKDEKNGGFFTCLDRKGQVYDTDKFMWLQGRQVWTFSFMFNHVEKKTEWLDMALLGARFLEKFGRDKDGNWYFSLTADGKPLVQPYNIFSDCFACMGLASLFKATGEKKYADIALHTFENIIRRQHNWKGIYNKAYPGTRPLKNFSLPMILCNLALELEEVIGTQRVNDMIPALIHDVMETFYHKPTGLILENVSPEGEFVDCFEGRLLNPGHAIEAMWFIMDLGKRIGDDALIRKATEIMLRTLEHGWDTEYEGIFYFMDVKGHPVQQLEWDQKLWWVHVEALVALAKGFVYTENESCVKWFKKLHDYTWKHFRDPEFGEWFGYLNRRGEVLLPLKGGKWKGCFHIPRSLYQVFKTLTAIKH